MYSSGGEKWAIEKLNNMRVTSDELLHNPETIKRETHLTFLFSLFCNKFELTGAANNYIMVVNVVAENWKYRTIGKNCISFS